MRKGFKYAMCLWLGILVFGGFICLPVMQYNEVNGGELKVLNITEQQNVSGTKESVSTSYKYIVTTDKGIFYIEPSGLFASSAFGNIEKGKTYACELRGFEIPFLGIYPYIIEAKEVSNE